jgi:hypothetical protein
MAFLIAELLKQERGGKASRCRPQRDFDLLRLLAGHDQHA